MLSAILYIHITYFLVPSVTQKLDVRYEMTSLETCETQRFGIQSMLERDNPYLQFKNVESYCFDYDLPKFDQGR